MEQVHRHMAPRGKKLTGDGQSALPWTRPAYISSLPFQLSLLLGDTEFWGAGVEQLYTQPAVNGDRKTTQLLRERCPKAHLGRLGGNTREKRHEQVPLVCRARKMTWSSLSAAVRNRAHPDRGRATGIPPAFPCVKLAGSGV